MCMVAAVHLPVMIEGGADLDKTDGLQGADPK